MGQPEDYQAEAQAPDLAENSNSTNFDDIDLDSPWIEDEDEPRVPPIMRKAMTAPSDKGPVAMVETAFLASAASLSQQAPRY